MKSMQIDDVVISEAIQDDIDTLFRWGDENWELWGGEKFKWFSKKSLVNWIADPKNDVLLVARKRGKAVGMCMVCSMRSWAFCVGLFVEKEFRRFGIGKMLLDEAQRKLREQGIESLILLVDVKNTGSFRFYQREKFDKGFQFHMMTKEL